VTANLFQPAPGRVRVFDRFESQFAVPEHRREHACELVNKSAEELLATDSPIIRLLGDEAFLSRLGTSSRIKTPCWMVSVCSDLDGMTVRITHQ